MTHSKKIHLYPNRFNDNLNIFLLFIPAIIFILILCLLTFKFSKKEILSEQESKILSGQTEAEDNQ